LDHVFNVLELYFRASPSVVSLNPKSLRAALTNFKAGMYIVARMILGFGIVFCIVSGSAMLGELSYPKEVSSTAVFYVSDHIERYEVLRLSL